jgi:hypothetical protein
VTIRGDTVFETINLVTHQAQRFLVLRNDLFFGAGFYPVHKQFSVTLPLDKAVVALICSVSKMDQPPDVPSSLDPQCPSPGRKQKSRPAPLRGNHRRLAKAAYSFCQRALPTRNGGWIFIRSIFSAPL